ncbi:MAG: CAP domain-containing protein [Solirubrobacteraceae bacterium]|nr:CAP domain-containing protein [Solirubrobacteraceae bacterium]
MQPATPHATRVGRTRPPAARAPHRRGLRRGVVALAATTATVLAAAPSAQAAGPCVDSDATPAQIGTLRTQVALLCLTNLERAAVGLNTVTPSVLVTLAAQRHVDDMTLRRYFAHDAPAPAPFGTSPSLRLSAAGYTWSAMGENLAVGQQTPRAVVTAWLASKGHCENLMSTAYRVAGFGVSTDGTGDYPGPTWSQTFARGLFADAPGGPSVACPRTPATRTPNVDLTPDAVPDPAPNADPVTPESVAGNRGSDEGGTKGSTTTTATRRLKVTARRASRRLSLRVTLPDSATRRVVRVTVLQSREKRQVKRWRRSGGRTVTLKVSIRAAKRGRATVRVGGQQRTVRFR